MKKACLLKSKQAFLHNGFSSSQVAICRIFTELPSQTLV